ncbi:hypothetical protein [Pseudooceanicola nanhaiensis]|uniref:hypothetical protein n=1 Tax=Pseudooceanicola nanhaiensis TaxID=375761 RepID=UPI003518118E
MSPRTLALLLLIPAAACTELPPVEQTVSAEAQAAPYPDLAPTASLTDSLPEGRIAPGDAAALEARGDALRRKAAAAGS